MSYTIPILINDVVDVKLPYTLFKDNEFEVFLDEFPISDREKIFDLSGIHIINGKTYFSKGRDNFTSLSKKFPEYVSSAFRLLVEPKNNTEEHIDLFKKISYNLDLCCILYFDYPITLTIFGNDRMSPTLHSIPTYRRRAEKIIVNREFISSFKKTLHVCINNLTVDKKKINMLFSLLNVSLLQSFNSGLICSTYITILESLFTDENTEITYRFAMRLTKFLNKDYAFSKYIKKLYGKRSAYYHSGDIKFDNEDETFLINYECILPNY